MAKRTKSYGLNNPLQDVFPVPVVSTRNPTVNDKGFEIGQQWVNTAETRVYSLTSVTAGSATWALLAVGTSDLDTLTGDTGGTISPDGSSNINIVGNDLFTVDGSGNSLTVTETTGAYPITPFVVGIAGQAGYTTIQSALDAADAAGGGTVYVQPGVFTENLTLYDSVDLWGTIGVADTETCKIIGTHLPPTSGAITIRNIFLENATDIFNSAMPADTNIILIDVGIDVTNGFTFNLPDWTGSLIGINIGEVQSTNDGWVNNTGGAPVSMTNMTVGAGTGQSMVTTGTVEIANCIVDCPIDFQTGTSALITGGSLFQKPVTFSDNSTAAIVNSTFKPTSGAGIIYQSSGDTSITSCGVDSGNSPAISGTGAGTLTITGVDFVRNNTIAATLTRAGGQTQSESFQTINQATHVRMEDNDILSAGTNANIDIDLIPKGTGVVTSTTEIQAPSISFDSGTNSLDNYIEAGWTPVLTLGGGTTGITYSTQNGRYVRVGSLVFLECAITLTSKGSDTGAVTITGVPIANGGAFRGIFDCQWERSSFTANYTELSGTLPNSGVIVSLVQFGDNVSEANITDALITDTFSLRFSGFYCVI